MSMKRGFWIACDACDAVAPTKPTRSEAGRVARDAAWARTSGKWYCPKCAIPVMEAKRVLCVGAFGDNVDPVVDWEERRSTTWALREDE